jgi:hypothetical protein
VANTQIKITADTRQAERAVANLESALSSISSVSRAAGIALGGITVASLGVAAAFKSLVDRTGDLADIGKALGVSAQQLKVLQQSAQLAGIGAGELQQAMFRLQGTLGDAVVKGTGPANAAIERLGLNLNEVARAPADKQINLITDALRKVEDPAERSALAIDLLGKQGPRMLEVAMNAARLAEQADKLGIALSDLEVANLERAGDAIDELAFIAGDTLDKALAGLAPYVVVLLERLKDAVVEAGGFDAIIRDRVVPAIKVAAQASAFFAAVWISGAIVAKMMAIIATIIKIYNAIKVMTSAMALFNAVVGANPLLKIAGALVTLTAGVAAFRGVGSMFDDLDIAAQALNKTTQDGLNKQAEGTGKVTAAVNQQNEAQKKVSDSLKASVFALEQSVNFERDKVTLGEAAANSAKMIADEERKLAEQKLKMDPLDKQRITNAYAALEAIKQQASLTKVIEGLDTERLGLATADKNQREITLAIRKQELEFGRSLNAVERESLTTAIQKTQQAREQAGIAEAIYNATRKQTELEKVNRGLSLQPRLNPQGAAATDYSKDMEGLQAMLDNKLISEQQYFAQREALTQQHNQKLRDFELTRINESLMAERNAMATTLSDKDRAIIQSVGAEERQKAIVADRINFEKKSDSEKTAFAIENAQSIFAALGAQNKKAFQASKALAVATAIMNTYQGATKAMATYPFPFNLIAAAASIAAGMAQVSAIRSQQYQGRQLGGPVMGGQSYMVGENGPELFTPNNTGSITRNGDLGGGGPVSVEFTIVANDTQGFDALLASRRGVITQIISDAMLERGQRSAM